jgi:hypothetical protein
VIQRSPHTITFLHPEGWSYYHTLREKLHWNEYPSTTANSINLIHRYAAYPVHP